MCGIIGILGQAPVAPLLLDALRRRVSDEDFMRELAK